MKRFLLFLIVCAAAITGAQARYDVDYSTRVDDPEDPECNTITAASGWGWYNIFTSSWDVMDYEYLYIKYEATCNFNLVVQDTNWKNLYSVTCSSTATEAYIKLVPHAVDYYTCVVIQNHSAGTITIDKFYFCTADEFFNPAPEDLEEARENLLNIRARYEAMLPGFTPGTGYGNYPPDLYQALSEALVSAAEAQDGEGGEDLTSAELNALAQAIVDAYRALVDAKIPYYPENGYYRFVVARQFNEYEKAEEGAEIDSTTVTHPLKAMYSDNTGTNGWKTLQNDSPNFIWTLERQENNTYVLAIVANRLTFTQAEKCTDGTRTIAFDPLVQHPEGYELDPAFTKGTTIEYDQRKAFEGADFIYAKNWSNPGVTNLADYGKITCEDRSWTVDTEHMSWTNNGKFMHCLPVRRNLIVTDDVIEAPNSLVIPEAANREISCSVVIKRMLETL